MMARDIFVLPCVGLVGGNPVGRVHMDRIVERAARLASACRKREYNKADCAQLLLPVVLR